MPGLPVKGSPQAWEQTAVGMSTAAKASLKLKRCIFMATTHTIKHGLVNQSNAVKILALLLSNYVDVGQSLNSNVPYT